MHFRKTLRGERGKWCQIVLGKSYNTFNEDQSKVWYHTFQKMIQWISDLYLPFKLIFTIFQNIFKLHYASALQDLN